MGRGSTQPLRSHDGIRFCSVPAGYRKGFLYRTSQQSVKTVHTLCLYVHIPALRHPVPGRAALLREGNRSCWQGSLLRQPPAAVSPFNSKRVFIFFSCRLVIFSQSEFCCTVAFQLLRLLRFCMVFLSSVNRHCRRNIAEAHSLPLLAAEAAFSRCRVQAMKPFVNALPLSLNTVCVYQKGRPRFLLCLILDFK